ncbi:hypothetical protein BKA60DRAFT_566207 [Fusarium oxysporum]|nr:hypothetical protein BKA60DRAFT_566207 [Fusarium oxysporum]
MFSLLLPAMPLILSFFFRAAVMRNSDMFRLLRLVLGKVQHSLVTAAANISSAQSQSSPGQAHVAGDPAHACILVCVPVCTWCIQCSASP